MYMFQNRVSPASLSGILKQTEHGEHCLSCQLFPRIFATMGWDMGTLWWTNILLWKITIFNGKIHYKWSFSIAMLVHQRVYHGLPQSLAPEVWVRNGSDHFGQPGHGWCWTGDGLVDSGFLPASRQMGSAVRRAYVLLCFRCFLVEQTWERCRIV